MVVSPLRAPLSPQEHQKLAQLIININALQAGMLDERLTRSQAKTSCEMLTEYADKIRQTINALPAGDKEREYLLAVKRNTDSFIRNKFYIQPGIQ